MEGKECYVEEETASSSVIKFKLKLKSSTQNNKYITI